MKLLYVSHVFPWPIDQGTKQRVFHLLRALAEKHDVTLLTFRSASMPAESLSIAGQLSRIILVDELTPRRSVSEILWTSISEKIRQVCLSRSPVFIRAWWSPAMVDALRRLRQESEFDAVWVERCFMAEMVAEAGFDRIAVDVDEVESTSLARWMESLGWHWSKPLHIWELWKTRRYERRLANRFSKLIVCKDEDRSLLGRDNSSVITIPNGTDHHNRLDARLEQANRIVFVGSLDYEPNVHGVSWFVENVLPRLSSDAVLTVVGRNPVPAVLALNGGKRCVVAADVPDVVPFYEAAAVVVAPIFLGGGTRLKVLEALALGKAVVATGAAVEGLDLEADRHYLRADTAADFARACQHLLHSGEARLSLGDAGRHHVLANYEWTRVESLACGVVESIAPQKVQMVG